MVIGILDFETTGTDLYQDQVTEVGKITYSTGLKRIVESNSYYIAGDRPIPKIVEEKVGITNAARKHFGYDRQDSLSDIVEWLGKVEAVAGHNINEFDWELLKSWAFQNGKTLPPLVLIDTMWDLPGVKGRQLSHMCADDGFLLLDTHSAIIDCLGVLKLIQNRLNILTAIMDRARSPIIVLQSLQDRDWNDQAKDRGFHWNDKPAHIWFKACKECDVEEIAKEAPFDVTIRRDVNLREVWR